ncbi:hypothetical protein SLAV_19660 [Streptomyces lavendulae subsp. lavendulae]|uniref:Uncharacterized protein n=1 Tax=Streptomyces lavendulae subsp. lavendulae TaxID=58340 RepID=A0A2K8PG82_STRLA|nr:hypothetical protein [Streptomyces lavendulae]ATZ25756.1 hypothetical protein SLAV_19660 [Streptomyces lavendulae subsp. lavendulae]QUQ55584.1 hypothetical protein SLLC_17760 [Streptomyces lavendulae subsp. lavendulae]
MTPSATPSATPPATPPDESAVEAVAEPHEPGPGERAARDRVRAEAAGMTHPGAREALEAARAAGADPAVVAEWQRIEEHLVDHGGPYSPASDPYVQGQLTARSHHDAPRTPQPARNAALTLPAPGPPAPFRPS